MNSDPVSYVVYTDLYQLSELQFLDVSSNQITRLPPSLRNLTSIQALRVMDNPLESPPSQVSPHTHAPL